MIRCSGCDAQGQDASTFRTYYPGVNDPAEHYCAVCWSARERENQRKGLLATSGFLVAALLAASLFDLGETTQLARLALFLVLFDVLSTVLHELGHAGAALLMGMRVHTISFGYGIVLHSFQLGRTTVELRSLPTCGFVRASLRTAKLARTRSALMTLAGPATNIALALGALTALGGWETSHVREMADVSPWHLLLVINAIIIVFNLVPFAYPDQREGGRTWLPNDGLLILRELFASPERVQEWVAGGAVAEASELLAAGDLPAARAIIEEALVASPNADILRSALASIEAAKDA